jgi:hypothetical protein
VYEGDFENDKYIYKAMEWDVDHVSEWLKENSFDEYIENFKFHKINGQVLYYIEKSDLKELGIDNIGVRVLMYNKIIELFSFYDKKKIENNSVDIEQNDNLVVVVENVVDQISIQNEFTNVEKKKKKKFNVNNPKKKK